MDRDTSRAINHGRLGASGPILPSRRAALNRLVAALGRGPVLISGEPGAGKTWLAGRLAEEAGDGIAWADVDVAPSTGPDELFAQIACQLGLESRSDRSAILAALVDSSRDGRSWGLRVDEAQNASAELLEEIRVLDNRLGRPDGFSAIVLIAQTSLVRRLGLRSFHGFETRLSAHAHLAPIDADEAALMLGDSSIDAEASESLHRSAMGNPARLLRLALAASGKAESPRIPLAGESATLLPARPPLRIEDGLIEVGWDADADGLSKGESADPDDSDTRNSAETAWVPRPADPDDFDDEPGAEVEEIPGPSTSLRAEGEHEFAPFSQLFARKSPTGETA